MKISLFLSACFAAAFALAGPAGAAPGKPIFKCVDAAGTTTFQAAPCDAGTQQSEVKLREEPKSEEPRAEVDPETGFPVEEPRIAVSYECTTSKGWVFYKHRPCPPGVREAKPVANPKDRSDSLAATRGEWLRVTGAQITRLQACRRINDVGAGSRPGRVFDDIVSDRERALGHDPCAQK